MSHLPIPETIERFQITHLSLVPTQLYRLIQEPRLEDTECILVGGGPTLRELLRKGKEQGLNVITTYGMTEMSSIITLSTGEPLPFREVKIDNENEIWVRGKTLFQGYWDPRSEQVITHPAEEWFPTKDLGQWTPDGALEIIGRKDRQFISGGENIQPEEVERALSAIPGVRQASVLPMDDKEFGQRPIAYIDDETKLHTLQTIQEALHCILPSFKHPIAIFPYPAETGLKPNLLSLREHLARFQHGS
jgi:O-succinylbenzoic acid--CoA ligase